MPAVPCLVNLLADLLTAALEPVESTVRVEMVGLAGMWRCHNPASLTRAHIEAISRSTRSSYARNGSLHSTVRCA
jgi:hypothetical protein